MAEWPLVPLDVESTRNMKRKTTNRFASQVEWLAILPYGLPNQVAAQQGCSRVQPDVERDRYRDRSHFLPPLFSRPRFLPDGCTYSSTPEVKMDHCCKARLWREGVSSIPPISFPVGIHFTSQPIFLVCVCIRASPSASAFLSTSPVSRAA